MQSKKANKFGIIIDILILNKGEYFMSTNEQLNERVKELRGYVMTLRDENWQLSPFIRVALISDYIDKYLPTQNIDLIEGDIYKLITESVEKGDLANNLLFCDKVVETLSSYENLANFDPNNYEIYNDNTLKSLSDKLTPLNHYLYKVQNKFIKTGGDYTFFNDFMRKAQKAFNLIAYVNEDDCLRRHESVDNKLASDIWRAARFLDLLDWGRASDKYKSDFKRAVKERDRGL